MNAESWPGKAASRPPRIVAALLIIATLLTLVAIFSVWINRQALNTDNWVNTSDKVLQNKDVQDQLSIFLADQLFANVDVQAELQKSLPPRLQPLAGPASGALHQLAPQVAQRALATPQFQTLWSQANRAAHETLLKIVDGGGSTVSTNGGQVTLDLSSLLKQIGRQPGGSGALASKIPPNARPLAFGILIVIGAWLAGPTRPAMAFRREASPYLREHRGGAYAAAAVVWLALIGLAPIAAFRKPLGILLFAVLFAVGTEILRRQALREVPENPGGGRGAGGGRAGGTASPASPGR